MKSTQDPPKRQGQQTEMARLSRFETEAHRPSTGGPDDLNGQVMQQLSRMLESDVFSGAERLQRFLHFVVISSLRTPNGPTDQRTIATEVYDRSASFNPAIDAIVRVEAGRLRAKLLEYYSSMGKHDPIRISLAKRGYSVLIETRQADPAVFAAPRSVVRAAGPRWVGDGSRPASIAVLPFDDLTSDSSFGCFCDSLARQVEQSLLKLTGLSVAASRSARQFKDRPEQLNVIGRELGVESVLEGSVQNPRDRLRVSVLVAATDTGQRLWSHVYERSFNDALAAQDDVSRAIANDLEAALAHLDSKEGIGPQRPDARFGNAG